MPRGEFPTPPRLAGRHSNGEPVPIQAAVLDRWRDGSPRWVLLDFQADVGPSASVTVETAASGPPTPTGLTGVLAGAGRDRHCRVSTGVAEFVVGCDRFPFDSVSHNGRPAIDPARCEFVVTAASGARCDTRISSIELEESGPVRVTVGVGGSVMDAGSELLKFAARLHFFAGKAAVKVDVELRNPRRASHPGGIWELGDPGSVFIRDVAVHVALPASANAGQVRCSATLQGDMAIRRQPFELYQDSSGGEQWRSRAHVNRAGEIPVSFRGYRIRAGSAEEGGTRATPIVRLEREDASVSIAMERFWENFPKAVTAAADVLSLHLFPGAYADPHEIQGGEQKTHTFWVAVGDDNVSDPPFDWCRAPSRAAVDPVWCERSGAVPFLTARRPGAEDDYDRLVDGAVSGADSFVMKREAIDEYGWRNFGDVYADHEAVFHKEPDRLVSHYNNQYDPLGGCIVQWLRTGDAAWWTLVDDLARHVVDIDVYHTDQDWAKYNHGMFWHTVHYRDAGKSTHRTYPRAQGVHGGGPSAGHLYTTGLLLHYFLTGWAPSRAAVVDLATYVIDSDDGRKSIFKWLSREPTGYASGSTGTYHGPGRAPANALNALVDAHRLTGEARFLEKAEAIIRRCIHPADDVDARQLLDVERRWFYTMFLQSLGKYLQHKRDHGDIDTAYGYARASLLAYARWMADHERPYLDHPEILEYPNETWAAQDMRKSEVFKWASLHASLDERTRFLERSSFFFDCSVRTLSSMPTRTLARPVILLLSYGWSHTAFLRDAPPPEPVPPVAADFGRPGSFVPQKTIAMRRAFFAAGALGVAALAGLGFLLLRLL